MTERDPFGNEIPDKPPPLAVHEPSSAHEPPTLIDIARPARRHTLVWARMISALVTVGVVGAIAFAFLIPAIDSAKDAVDQFRIPTFSVPGVTIADTRAPQASADSGGPPAGLQPGSMLRSDQMLEALPKLRAQGSRLQTMRIDAERISANLIGSDGRLKVVSIAYDGTVNVVRTQANLSAVPATSLSAVTSKAPARVVARAAAALGRPATTVNYIALVNIGGASSWYVYFKDGKYLRGSLDGRRVERVG